MKENPLFPNVQIALELDYAEVNSIMCDLVEVEMEKEIQKEMEMEKENEKEKEK